MIIHLIGSLLYKIDFIRISSLYLDSVPVLLDPLDPGGVLDEVAHVGEEGSGEEIHPAVDQVKALLE